MSGSVGGWVYRCRTDIHQMCAGDTQTQAIFSGHKDLMYIQNGCMILWFAVFF